MWVSGDKLSTQLQRFVHRARAGGLLVLRGEQLQGRLGACAGAKLMQVREGLIGASRMTADGAQEWRPSEAPI